MAICVTDPACSGLGAACGVVTRFSFPVYEQDIPVRSGCVYDGKTIREDLAIDKSLSVSTLREADSREESNECRNECGVHSASQRTREKRRVPRRDGRACQKTRNT